MNKKIIISLGLLFFIGVLLTGIEMNESDNKEVNELKIMTAAAEMQKYSCSSDCESVEGCVCAPCLVCVSYSDFNGAWNGTCTN